MAAKSLILLCWSPPRLPPPAVDKVAELHLRVLPPTLSLPFFGGPIVASLRLRLFWKISPEAPDDSNFRTRELIPEVLDSEVLLLDWLMDRFGKVGPKKTGVLLVERVRAGAT